MKRHWHASQHIYTAFPAELRGEAMLPFIRRVLNRVCLVELDAGGPKRGKAMFVAMNDRGVRLAPLDHLKSFMLTDAPDDPDKLDAQWQSMIATLEAIDKDAPLDYVRTVLRSQSFDVDPTEESAWARNETPHEWLDTHQSTIWPAKKGAPARLFTQTLDPVDRRRSIAVEGITADIAVRTGQPDAEATAIDFTSAVKDDPGADARAHQRRTLLAVGLIAAAVYRTDCTACRAHLDRLHATLTDLDWPAGHAMITHTVTAARHLCHGHGHGGHDTQGCHRPPPQPGGLLRPDVHHPPADYLTDRLTARSRQNNPNQTETPHLLGSEGRSVEVLRGHRHRHRPILGAGVEGAQSRRWRAH